MNLNIISSTELLSLILSSSEGPVAVRQARNHLRCQGASHTFDISFNSLWQVVMVVAGTDCSMFSHRLIVSD